MDGFEVWDPSRRVSDGSIDKSDIDISASCGYCWVDRNVNAPWGGIVFAESLAGGVLITGGAKGSARAGETVLVAALVVDASRVAL